MSVRGVSAGDGAAHQRFLVPFSPLARRRTVQSLPRRTSSADDGREIPEHTPERGMPVVTRHMPEDGPSNKAIVLTRKPEERRDGGME